MTLRCPVIEFQEIAILKHINHEVLDVYIHSVIATLKFTDGVKALRENRLPVFMAWSRNDKMIEEKLSRDLLSTLGMHTEKGVPGDHPGTMFLQR